MTDWRVGLAIIIGCAVGWLCFKLADFIDRRCRG